ncbi:annulin-like [Octopus sinensis]|uniref:Annulin-like n=1 Tax=Octopus sinensis TaxID=2607531 RepID=A0A6P7T405_9MOLL|nr:annulin-like [Octopus sinensis]
MEVPRPLIPSADPEYLSKVFRVLRFDYMPTTNASLHNTSKFYSTNQQALMIRRGLPFKIKITFNEKYDPDIHEVSFVLLAGDRPAPGLDTHVHVELNEGPFEDEVWWCKTEENSETGLILSLHPPANCIIGEWDIFVKTLAPSDESVNYYLYDHNSPFYVLFNPWCEADQVYLDSPELLKDYVLNESLTIFVGTKEQLNYKHWYTGQFDDGVLDLTLYLLRKAFSLVNSSFSNPVTVIEGLNRMVAYDSNAVMSIHWYQCNPESRRPTAWSSSVEIIQEYKKGLGKVKYGCCWTNAALLTTFCRALGIPARVVTSFKSNHDINSNKISHHYLTMIKSLKRLPHLTHQSIWNFHVWMDAWTLRPDLPSGHGWHAVEPTPKKLEFGMSVYGPTPLSFIKEGNIGTGQDVNNFFHDLNVKSAHYIRTSKGWSLFQTDPDIVGTFICTAAPLGKPVCTKDPYSIKFLYHDITEEYKSSSTSENSELLPANQVHCSQSVSHIRVEFPENYNCKIGEIQIIKFDLHNPSQETIKVNFVMEVQAIDYTGRENLILFEESVSELVISPGSSQQTSISIRPENYVPVLQRGLPYRFAMKLIIYGFVKGCNMKFTCTKVFTPQWPNLEIKCPDNTALHDKLPVELSLKNPLPVPLTHCEVVIDGAGLTSVFKGSLLDIPDFSDVSLKMKLSACCRGTAHLTATIHSIELQDVWSCTTINIV